MITILFLSHKALIDWLKSDCKINDFFSMPCHLLASDSWSKAVASWIINFLPYARSATTAKNRLVYSRMSPSAATVGIIIGAIPLILLPGPAAVAAVAPIVVTGLMIIYLRHKIGGYTGDCCGATFLLSELAMLLAVSAMLF